MTESLRADPSLDHARKAQALLGPDVWSRVIRVENSSKRSLYPAKFHALVFEFNDRLWFYTDTDGTQSFSLYRDHLKEDKQDFYPMLREIDPGFRQHVILEQVWVEKPGVPLLNGCFIESLSMARDLDPAEAVIRAGLLSTYVGEGKNRVGHTVLAYETEEGVYVRDPVEPGVRRWIARTFPAHEKTLAEAVFTRLGRISAAKLIPVSIAHVLNVL